MQQPPIFWQAFLWLALGAQLPPIFRYFELLVVPSVENHVGAPQWTPLFSLTHLHFFSPESIKFACRPGPRRGSKYRPCALYPSPSFLDGVWSHSAARRKRRACFGQWIGKCWVQLCPPSHPLCLQWYVQGSCSGLVSCGPSSCLGFTCS